MANLIDSRCFFVLAGVLLVLPGALRAMTSNPFGPVVTKSRKVEEKLQLAQTKQVEVHLQWQGTTCERPRVQVRLQGTTAYSSFTSGGMLAPGTWQFKASCPNSSGQATHTIEARVNLAVVEIRMKPTPPPTDSIRPPPPANPTPPPVVTPRPKTSWLEISGVPAGTIIQLLPDGPTITVDEALERLELVPKDSYMLHATHEDYEGFHSQIRIDPEKTATITVHMVPLPGTIAVVGEPITMHVKLEGAQGLVGEKDGIPFRASNLKPGTYMLTASHPGFVTQKNELKLEPRKVVTVPMVLDRLGRIVVTGDPEGAAVKLNDSSQTVIGKLPATFENLLPAQYTLRISEPLYATSTQYVTVSLNNTRDIAVNLRWHPLTNLGASLLVAGTTSLVVGMLLNQEFQEAAQYYASLDATDTVHRFDRSRAKVITLNAARITAGGAGVFMIGAGAGCFFKITFGNLFDKETHR